MVKRNTTVRRVAILGSTGSIGTQTLDLIRLNGDLEVVALAADKNIVDLEKQVREFKPAYACIYDPNFLADFSENIKDTDTKVLCGMDGLKTICAASDVDLVVVSVVGMVGIEPTIEAIKNRKQVALANKETLVAAGHIIMPLAKEYGVEILPLDSEHSAIFQSLQGNRGNKIKRIILTASGGPFREYTKEQLQDVTLEQALKHPNWSMGKKVTLDSASMVNKGLEVIEARWLFDVDPSKIEVHVHPQSALHSGVEYEDGAIMASIGVADMHTPISYALYYPERRPAISKSLDLFAMGHLDFYKPDLDVFKGLKLAYRAIEKGGVMPCVFNAANEEAVKLLLDGKIKFVQVPDVIEKIMDRFENETDESLENILDIKRRISDEVMKEDLWV